MTRNDTAIINPVKDQKSPQLGSLAIMVATQTDLNRICRKMGYGKEHRSRLFMSDLFVGLHESDALAVAGPMIGAPYAVMVLETLIAWGAKQFIFFGWCGAVSSSVKIGDIILPTAAIIDEGTSRHYQAEVQTTIDPADALFHKIRERLVENSLAFHEGKVWTTDAIYRETERKVAEFYQLGAIGVEMELSALFTAARFRKVDLAGILVVSDDVSTEKWQPGFKSSRFTRSCKRVAEILNQLSMVA